jgi:hypothetical protein
MGRLLVEEKKENEKSKALLRREWNPGSLVT